MTIKGDSNDSCVGSEG